MQPITFEGAEELKGDEVVDGVSILTGYADNGIDDAGQPFFVTQWKPSYEDLKALNSGGSVYVKTIGEDLPPMLLFTTNENGEHNDAG